MIDYNDGSTDANAYDTSSVNDPTTLHSLGTGEATQSGNLTGTGSIIKTGAGAITLSGTNSYSGETTINEGTLRLANGTFFGTDTGTLRMEGGAIGNDEVDDFADVANNIVATQDFAIDVRGENGLIAFDGNVNLGTAATRSITLMSLGEACFSGQISGQNIDLVTTAASSSVRFCDYASNTFTGTMRVGNGVTLNLERVNGGAGDPIAISGDLLVDAGGTAGIAFNGGQFATTSNVTINGNATLASTTSANTFHSLSGTGTITAISDFASANTLEVQSGTFDGMLTETGGTLTLHKTGTETLTLTNTNTFTGDTTIDGGQLVVDGSLVTSAISVNDGGTLAGTGIVGAVTINSGGAITTGEAPSTFTTGMETWKGGGAYQWKINDAGGDKGLDPGYDFLSINGALAIESSAAPGDTFTIYVNSLGFDDNLGNAVNFDPDIDHSWTIATATGITGFDPSKFLVDTTAFQNPVSPGSSWHVTSNGTDLQLNYTAVPEPRDLGILVGMGLLLLVTHRRSRRTS